jgi:hypothetical protein
VHSQHNNLPSTCGKSVITAYKEFQSFAYIYELQNYQNMTITCLEITITFFNYKRQYKFLERMEEQYVEKGGRKKYIRGRNGRCP